MKKVVQPTDAIPAHLKVMRVAIADAIESALPAFKTMVKISFEA